MRASIRLVTQYYGDLGGPAWFSNGIYTQLTSFAKNLRYGSIDCYKINERQKQLNTFHAVGMYHLIYL